MKFGLIGKNIQHSLSPKIHKIILDEIKINGEYNLFDVEENELEDMIKYFLMYGYTGINVTIPYKIKIMKYLNSIDNDAKNIGACNTVFLKGNDVVGYNTDFVGFYHSIKKYFIPYNDVNVLIIGTGGVSKAVSEFFKKFHGNKVFFVSREKTGENILSYKDLNNIQNMDIVINCSPCGSFPNINETPIMKNVIRKFKYAIDLIYNPKETRFLKIAKECGLIYLNGFHMLILQAVNAEEIWNNISIEDDAINKIINRCYNEIL